MGGKLNPLLRAYRDLYKKISAIDTSVFPIILNDPIVENPDPSFFKKKYTWTHILHDKTGYLATKAHYDPGPDGVDHNYCGCQLAHFSDNTKEKVLDCMKQVYFRLKGTSE